MRHQLSCSNVQPKSTRIDNELRNNKGGDVDGLKRIVMVLSQLKLYRPDDREVRDLAFP